MLIKLAGLVPESFVDGPGIRFTVFTQGCPHKCEGCHNPETHDFNGGRLADVDKIFKKILSFPLVKGVTFSGGEPFCQPEQLAYLAKLLKEKNYHIISYSGYTFEELFDKSKSNQHIDDLLRNIDILIDGKFILSERSLELRFRGSKNQRIVDVKESLKSGKAVLVEI